METSTLGMGDGSALSWAFLVAGFLVFVPLGVDRGLGLIRSELRRQATGEDAREIRKDGIGGFDHAAEKTLKTGLL